MTLFKAVRPHPLDVGGRVLHAGEIADLDPTDPVVADLISREDLTAIPDAPPVNPPLKAAKRATEES